MRRRTLLGLLGGGAAAGGGGAAALGGLPGGSGPQNESEGRGPTADCSELEQRVGELEAQVSALREERDGLQVAHDERIGGIAQRLYRNADSNATAAGVAEEAMKDAIDNGEWVQAQEKVRESLRNWQWAAQGVVDTEAILNNHQDQLKATVVSLSDATNITWRAHQYVFSSAELLEFYIGGVYGQTDPRRIESEMQDQNMRYELTSIREDREAVDWPSPEEFEAALWVDS